MKKIIFILSLCLILVPFAHADEYLGNYSVNPYAPDSTSNPYGAGSFYNPDGINNPYSEYGSPFSNKSVNNPYATQAPMLFDSQGDYKGRLSTNPYDPDSISNPYGQYGSPLFPGQHKQSLRRR